jgi:hypothetical protein
MAVDMPSRDRDVHLSCFGNSHMFRVFLHACSKVFRPLANYVVGKDNAEESDEGNGGENDEVNAAVSRMT